MRRRIADIVTTAFEPTSLDVRDESAAHAGHASTKAHGGGHYAMTIVSPRFRGLSRQTRHRAIYHVLHVELQAAIHALTIAAYTPEEWSSEGNDGDT